MKVESMRVLFLSSEVVPYAKTGGLADVGGALPQALRSVGHDVLTMLPLYGSIDRGRLTLMPDSGGSLGHGSIGWELWEDPTTNTRFVDIPRFYSRAQLYTNDPDEHLRFGMFCLVALEHVISTGWIPDLIHCNDWQTGLVPALIRGPFAGRLGTAKTVMTIHNLGYQGVFAATTMPTLGLEAHESLLHQDHLADGYVSFLETGLINADAITTVSPTYASEIQTPEGGAGLDALLRSRSEQLTGILNGIDTGEWNPRTDPHIPWRFSEKSLWRKERNKEALLDRMGLGYRKHVPVVGIITRLAAQKGVEIMQGPLIHFLETWDMRLVVVGNGEAEYEDFFASLTARFTAKAAFFNGFDNALAHLVEAGSDIFLMPSLYEPCGLNQMYSLAYGTIPVVRRVGGLADTVEQAEPGTGSGTGVVFDHYNPEGLGWALGRALTLHLDRPGWQILQKNGMAIDNSWSQRAAEYETLYRDLIG